MYKCDRCGKDTENTKYLPLSSGKSLEIHRCDSCDEQLTKEIEWECENEHFEEDGIICPYCDYEFDSYTSYQYEEGEEDIDCPVCGKTFCIEVKVTTTFTSHRRAEDMPENWDGVSDE